MTTHIDPELKLSLLEQEHAKLELSLKLCKSSPLMWRECQELKKKKLKLKDRIARLKSEMDEPVVVHSNVA